MDSDITLNKPDLSMWQCRGMVYKPSVSTRNISFTIFPILYLPDLPLAIFQFNSKIADLPLELLFGKIMRTRSSPWKKVEYGIAGVSSLTSLVALCVAHLCPLFKVGVDIHDDSMSSSHHHHHRR